MATSTSLSNSDDCSVSQLAKGELDENHKEYPACCHWFALALYNLHHTLKHDKDLKNGVDDIRVTFLEKDYTIKRVCLNQCAKSIEAAVDICDETKPLDTVGVRSKLKICSAEITYTSLYSRALDNFLFSEDFCEEGASLHQFPSRIRTDDTGKDNKQTIERADITVVSLPNLVPIMCSDIKIDDDDFNLSVRETLLYGVNCAAVQSGPYKWPLLLGMPGTPSYTILQVYRPIPDQFWRSTILKSPFRPGPYPYDEAFLCTLFVGVWYLLSLDPDVDYVDTPPECYCPLKDVKYEVVSKNKPWIVKQGDKCLKIFDKTNGWSSDSDRLELLNKIGLSYECQYLSDDLMLFMIVRDFIVGRTKPPKDSDIAIFKGALQCLKKVHEQRYIHGYVRRSNIIFTADGTSHLINFDWVNTSGSKYPPSYGKRPSLERHPKALCGKPMKKEHDVHSMKYIMSVHFPEKKSVIDSCDDTIDDLLTMIDEQESDEEESDEEESDEEESDEQESDTK